MAVAGVIEAAAGEGGLEGILKGGGKKQAGFIQDSAGAAKAGGVTITKFISGGLNLASSALNLANTRKKGKEEAQDIKERRFAAGLLTKNENRRNLLNEGQLAAYWAPSNIRSLLSRGILPFSWEETTAVGQGFGPEVAAFLLRQRRGAVAAERTEKAKLGLVSRKVELASEFANAQAKGNLVANRIRASVV